MKELNHLSGMDGAFLHLESPETPMHVGALALLEPPAPEAGPWFDSFRAHVISRMHLAPVFTRKLAPMPLDLANPVWIADDDVDLDHHIRRLVLPKPGSLAQLEALVARLHSSLLDRGRPMWEFYVIEGLADARIGFYAKLHHAAVDGQAAVALGETMFDLSPEPRRVKPPRPQRSNRHQPGVVDLLSAALSHQIRQTLDLGKLLPPLAGAAYQAAKSALAQRHDGLGKTAKSETRFKMAPPTPFNTPITNQRSFASATLPLGEIKDIGKAHGASVNDMVLWLCSTALRGYLVDAHSLPQKTLVAFVPISLRSQGDTSSNNQVSATLLDLATNVADPLRRLEGIMTGTRAMKQQLGAFGTLIPKDFPSLGTPWLLSGLASLYGRSRLAGSLRVVNVVISNVPGAQMPLYLARAKMAGTYPLSIVVHGVALNITVQSYLGQLCFGLIACRHAVPDVAAIARHLERALETLRHLPQPAPVSAESVAPVQMSAARKRAVRAVKPAPADAGPAAAPGTKRARAKPRLVAINIAPTPPARRTRRAAGA